MYQVDIIKDYLKDNRLSKAKFCKNCHISTNTLNRILKNDLKVDMIALFKISLEMEVPLSELIGEKSE